MNRRGFLLTIGTGTLAAPLAALAAKTPVTTAVATQSSTFAAVDTTAYDKWSAAATEAFERAQALYNEFSSIEIGKINSNLERAFSTKSLSASGLKHSLKH